MEITTINLGTCPLQYLSVGYVGETGARPVAFDFSAWATEYGAGVLQLLLLRPGDANPYPVVLDIDGTTATWTPDATATEKTGQGQAQLVYTVSGVIVKNAVFRVLIAPSLGAAGDPPEPYEDWLERLLTIAAEAQQSAIDAAGSAEAAGTSADAASESAGAAEQSALDAEAEKTGAEAAEQTAQQAAALARAKAAEAAEAAQIAGREADYAQQQNIAAGYSAESAHDDAELAAQSAGDAQAAASAAQTAASAAGASAAAAAAAVAEVETKGAEQIAAINQAGATQIAAVDAAGAAQVQAVEDKGEEVLESIPEDYTELISDVDDLKTAITQVGLNLVGMDTTVYYPVNIPAGGTVTISTADGQPTPIAIPLYFYDSNKAQKEWYPLQANKVQRTITLAASLGAISYLRLGTVGSQNIMVSLGDSALPYAPYDDGYIALKGEVSQHEEEINTLLSLTSKVRGDRITGWADLNNVGTGYIKPNGGYQGSDYLALSDYIPVLGGDSITYSLNCNIGGVVIMAIACYDKDKTFLPNAGVQASTAITGTYVLPDEVAFVRICEHITKLGYFYMYEAIDQKDAIEELFAEGQQTNLTGLKIALIGDSTYAITGGGSASNQRINNYLEKLSGATVSNFAIGGTLLAAIRTVDTWKYYDFVNLMTAKCNDDMSEQLSETNLSGKPGYIATVVNNLNNADLTTYDVLIINYGTNDYASDAPISDPTDIYAVNTIEGAMRTMLDRILTAYPNLHIVFNTPFWRCWNSPSDYVNDAFTRVNGAGLKLDDYIDAISNVAAGEYGLPVMYNLHECGWNKYNMDTYFDSNDGTHFNINGAKETAVRTFEFLNAQGFALARLNT